MSSKNVAYVWKVGLGNLIGCGIGIGIMYGISRGLGYYYEHKDDEKGTIINKTDSWEVIVDTNGDKNPDRVIHFEPEYAAYYNYAQSGDKISYTNNGDKTIVTVGAQSYNNKIHKINGKSLDEIDRWNELSRYVKMKTR